MSLWTTLFSGLFTGLLARDAAPQTPPTPPPPQPQLDPGAIYHQLMSMGALPEDTAQPFQLYSTRAATPADIKRLFAPAQPLPGVVPEGTRAMAMDDLNNPAFNYGGFGGLLTEGMYWLGFPYLAELSQRTEYRRISETIAKDMTRRWFRIQAKGKDDKSDKISALEACIKHHKLKEKFTVLALMDGFFGRAHLYLDMGDGDDRVQMKLPLPVDPRMVKRDGLKGIRVVEPMWCYPNMYNANDPLKENFYLPQTWWVMGKEVHRTRLMPFIGREMPDMMKPAYSFGGLSLSQMAKPYVDNWLRTRQSVSDLIHSFSTPVLMTNMGSVMNAGAAQQLKMRAALFNFFRDNSNLMALDKTTEDFKNVSAPLGSLDHLQAQSQEHMASAVGIPLVVLLGISPSGLNATSEGELQVWAQFIHASQGNFFDANLTTILNIMQLSLFGEIDPAITHAWEPLREMSEQEEAAARKSDADLDAVYVNAGVLSPDEIRQKLADESDSPYQGLDLSTPAPPPPNQEPDPLGGMGGGGGPGGPPGGAGGPPGAGGGADPSGLSKPAGGSPAPVQSGPGKMGAAGGTAKPPDPNKGSRDEDANGLAPGESHVLVKPKDPDAAIHVHLGQNDRGHVQLGADADPEWDESKIKRADNGQFGSGGGAATAKTAKQAKRALGAKAPKAGKGSASLSGVSHETNASNADVPAGAVTFSAKKPATGSLHGVAFKAWDDHPTTSEGWQAEADKGPEFEEPEVPPLKGGRKQAAGVIVQEPDGRVWTIRPSNAYGGYKASFPKGGVDKGDSLRSTAIKEAFEESGLRVELTGFAGDAMRDTSQARYYYAKRVGGSPSAHGWETEGVSLVPPGELHQHLNKPIDRLITQHLIEGGDEHHPLDLSGMTKFGGKLGSNPGGQYEDASGRKFYAKESQSENHAKNELLATRLYEMAHAPVLHAMPAMVGGKLGTASEWVSGKQNIDLSNAEDRRAAQKNFATQAWLANWDAIGMGQHENDWNQARVDGVMHTVDTGGSLLYRAQGGPKGGAFGNTVTEWDSMRHPVPGLPDAVMAHKTYGEMSPKRLREFAARVTSIPDHAIRAAVHTHGPGDHAAKEALADKLIARRDDIAKRVEELPTGDEAIEAFDYVGFGMDVMIGEWDEEAHPREKTGKFTKGAGETGGGGGEALKPKKPVPELTKYAGPVGAKMKKALEEHIASGNDNPHALATEMKEHAGKFKSSNVAGFMNQLIDHLADHHSMPKGALGKAVKMKGGVEGPPSQGAPSEAEMNAMAAEPEDLSALENFKLNPEPEPPEAEPGTAKEAIEAAKQGVIPDLPAFAKNNGTVVNIHSMADKGFTKAAGLLDYMNKGLDSGAIKEGSAEHGYAKAVIMAKMAQEAGAAAASTPEPEAPPTYKAPDPNDYKQQMMHAIATSEIEPDGKIEAIKNAMAGSVKKANHLYGQVLIDQINAGNAPTQTALPQEAAPHGPSPQTPLEKDIVKAAELGTHSDDKLLALQSVVDLMSMKDTDKAFQFAQKWADSLYGGAGAKLKPTAAAAPDGPAPFTTSKHQMALYSIVNYKSQTNEEKVEALKAYPTVKDYPDGYTAKFANSWIKALGGEPIPGVGFVDASTPTVPATPKPPPKPSPQSLAAKAAFAAPKTPPHGSLTAPANVQVLQAPKSPDLSHALTLEAATKKPHSTNSPESFDIVPSMNTPFWNEVAHGKDAQAFDSYGGGGYHDINGVLRDPKTQTPDAIAKIHAMRAIFHDERVKITEPLQLVRGEEMTQAQIKKIRDDLASGIGTLAYTRTGFTSASIGDKPGYKSGANTYWHFQCEKGTPVLGIAGKVGHHEREVLLDHHQLVEIYEVYHDGQRTHIKARVR